jgi:hypothetical protein
MAALPGARVSNPAQISVATTKKVLIPIDAQWPIALRRQAFASFMTAPSPSRVADSTACRLLTTTTALQQKIGSNHK